MNKATAIKYLTGPIAFAYKPRRMPWDHDQDKDNAAAKTMLNMCCLLYTSPSPRD